jgi:hypothetical protein
MKPMLTSRRFPRRNLLQYNRFCTSALLRLQPRPLHQGAAKPSDMVAIALRETVNPWRVNAKQK